MPSRKTQSAPASSKSRSAPASSKAKSAPGSGKAKTRSAPASKPKSAPASKPRPAPPSRRGNSSVSEKRLETFKQCKKKTWSVFSKLNKLKYSDKVHEKGLLDDFIEYVKQVNPDANVGLMGFLIGGKRLVDIQRDIDTVQKTIDAAQDVLCRYPMPSEMAAWYEKETGGALAVIRASIRVEVADNDAEEIAALGQAISDLVGPEGVNISEITQSNHLLYAWVIGDKKSSKRTIMAWGVTGSGRLKEAMKQLRDKLDFHLSDTTVGEGDNAYSLASVAQVDDEPLMERGHLTASGSDYQAIETGLQAHNGLVWGVQQNNFEPFQPNLAGGGASKKTTKTKAPLKTKSKAKSPVGISPARRKIYEGPRGGKYYLTPSGDKKYM